MVRSNLPYSWLAKGALTLVVGAFLASIAVPANAGSLRKAAASAAASSGAAAADPGSVLYGYYDVSEPTTDNGTCNGDNVMRLINTTGQDMCALIYVFDDDEQLGECCGCPLTANEQENFLVSTNIKGCNIDSDCPGGTLCRAHQCISDAFPLFPFCNLVPLYPPPPPPGRVLCPDNFKGQTYACINHECRLLPNPGGLLNNLREASQDQQNGVIAVIGATALTGCTNNGSASNGSTPNPACNAGCDPTIPFQAGVLVQSTRSGQGLNGNIVHNQRIGAARGLLEVNMFDDSPGDSANTAANLQAECKNAIQHGSGFGWCACPSEFGDLPPG